MVEPLVSFLVRCYGADSLKRCIRSIKNQTRKDYEILYVIPRDGSSPEEGICYICTTPKERERIEGAYVVVIDSDLKIVNNELVDKIWKLSLEEAPDVIRWSSPRLHSSYALKRSLFIHTVNGCNPLTNSKCPLEVLLDKADIFCSSMKVTILEEEIMRGRGGPIED